MIVLANKTYGGYVHTAECVEHFGMKSPYDRIGTEDRTDPELIEFYRNHERGDIGFCYVPEYATDWDLMEDDGLEWVIFVLHGKLHYSQPY